MDHRFASWQERGLLAVMMLKLWFDVAEVEQTSK